MNAFLRAFATPLVIAGFLAIGGTGLIMFFDLDARGLKDVHKWIGLLFAAAGLLHVAFNWRGFLMRFKRNPGLITMAALVLVAAGITLYVQLGFAAGPARAGNPTRMVLNAIAKAPLSASAPALGLSAEEATARLQAEGMTVTSPDESLRDIAKAADLELPDVFSALLKTGKPATDHEAGGHADHDH